MNETPELCSEASVQVLEFPSYLKLVAAEASTDLGEEELQARTPLAEAYPLRRRQKRIEEVGRLLVSGSLVSSLEIPLRPLLRRVMRGSVGVEGTEHLEGTDLLLLARVLGMTTEATRRIATEEIAPEQLRGLSRGLPDLADLCEGIEAALDLRGEVRDDASPLLRRLRKDIRRVRDRLYKELKSLLQASGDHFSEETIPLHGGRLVLLLNSGSRGRIRGLVHGRSATGRSFYFEPLDAVEANNELQSLLEEERAEKLRILAALAAEARERAPEIDHHARFLATLDADQACCRFGRAAEARFAEIGEDYSVVLLGARHPLLDPRLSSQRLRALGHAGHQGDVVPLDLSLDPDQRMLVVTGPNAGGKTAALKTLGLLALAHQSGLPIPVDPGSRLPVLRHIVATIGDEQDLLADQSTFSGRLLRLKEVWQTAGEGSLVLLDELGSGTDPEEGSALSTTLLEGLLERGTLGLITTHLTPVAALAMESEGAACAAMEFDDASGRPTYRLQRGAPGGSHAIDLARRMGLPEEWLTRAEAVLGDDHRRLQGVLAEVEELRAELGRERREIEVMRRELAAQEGGLDEAREALEEERRKVSKNARRELKEFREKVQRELRSEVERLTQGGSKKRSTQSSKKSRAVVPETLSRLFEDAPEAALEPEREAAPVEVGQEVEHLGFGWVGTAERMEKGKVWVRVRGMSMAVEEGDLRPASQRASKGGSGKPMGSRGSRPPVRGPVKASEEGPTVERELKLIGKRVEPALDELDSYLDRALLASVEEVRVIHGHGTGRLRDAVREHLRGHPAVDGWKRAPREQGGDGATLVTLQNL